jgi:hypothetical protein
MLGYELAQMEGLVITKVETALLDLFYWEEVRAGQYPEVVDQEEQYRCRNGDLLSVRRSIQPPFHEDSTLLLVRVVTNQSERVAQETLAHTLSAVRATLESTGNGILVIDWLGGIDRMSVFGFQDITQRVTRTMQVLKKCSHLVESERQRRI